MKIIDLAKNPGKPNGTIPPNIFIPDLDSPNKKIHVSKQNTIKVVVYKIPVKLKAYEHVPKIFKFQISKKKILV